MVNLYCMWLQKLVWTTLRKHFLLLGQTQMELTQYVTDFNFCILLVLMFIEPISLFNFNKIYVLCTCMFLYKFKSRYLLVLEGTYILMYFEYRYTTVFYELIHVPDCRFNLWNNKTLKLVLKLLRGKVNICKHAAFLENMHLPFALSFGLEYWPDSSTCSKCHWKCGMCERNIGGWSRLWCFGQWKQSLSTQVRLKHSVHCTMVTHWVKWKHFKHHMKFSTNIETQFCNTHLNLKFLATLGLYGTDWYISHESRVSK